MSSTFNSFTNWLQQISLEKPILTALVLMVIALFFKGIDTFVLRLDERWGEIILSKSLGFILVVLFVWLTRHKLKDIGLHSKKIWQSLLIGGTSGGMGPLVNNPLGKRTFCVLVTWYHKQREYLIHVLFALQMSSRRECRSKWFTLGKYQSILVLCRHAL